MTAPELLADLARQGFTLTPEGDGIRVRPASRLPEELRQAVRLHKAELLALLAAGRPWDQTAANALVDLIQAARRERFGPSEWPADRGACRELRQHFDRMGSAWDCRDEAALESAVRDTLALIGRLPPPGPPPSPPPGCCPSCCGPLDDKDRCWRCAPRTTTWPGEDAAELLAWFTGLTWPCEPFALACWRQVTDPELFCRTLDEDIRRGPAGPHVHHGHVISDLRALRRVFGGADGGNGDATTNERLPPDVGTTERILTGDCLALLPTLPAGCADLVFIDPPFNIGLDYPDYDDDRPEAEHLARLEQVFRAVLRVLSPAGSLWVAIGTGLQAELCVLLKRLGLHWRNTVPWHYGFGQHQERKLTPSWVALHYFVKDPGQFTFNRDAVWVPSARQAVYGDKRAKAGGKTPDDVWVTWPPAAEALGFFDPVGDAWHVRREAGTFKGRVDHPCQMPDAVLERIVLLCSNPGDLVLDPMCGPGSTLAAASRLGRRYLGIELCAATAALARDRLAREQPPVPGPVS
jgi:site-specific DNA-methyltransferase (adenine-specific)